MTKEEAIKYLSCPLCRMTNLRITEERGELSIIECRSCGLKFTLDIPDAPSMGGE